MKNLIVYCLLCLLLLGRSCSAREKPSEPQYPSRAVFAAKMAKVYGSNMTQAQIRESLGLPDVVKKGYDYSGSESWLYGVMPKSGCPTLGMVEFDKDKKVISCNGGSGKPPSAHLISEAKLRELLGMLWSFGHDNPQLRDGYRFDPLACIKVVNTLLPYGKERVLAVADEYLRVCEPEHDNVMSVLRVLFNPPDSHSAFPETNDSRTFPPVPSDKTRVPRYPLVLVEDIPIYIVHGQGGGAFMIDTDRFMDYLKKYGQIRKTPLCPSADPLSILDKLATSDQWLFGREYPSHGLKFATADNWLFGKKYVANHYQSEQQEEKIIGRHIVMLQLLRLIRSVLPATSRNSYLARIKDGHTEIRQAEWSRLQTELVKHPIHWNPQLNAYQAN